MSKRDIPVPDQLSSLVDEVSLLCTPIPFHHLLQPPTHPSTPIPTHSLTHTPTLPQADTHTHSHNRMLTPPPSLPHPSFPTTHTTPHSRSHANTCKQAHKCHTGAISQWSFACLQSILPTCEQQRVPARPNTLIMAMSLSHTPCHVRTHAGMHAHTHTRTHAHTHAAGPPTTSRVARDL